MAGRGKGIFLPFPFVSTLLHMISILDPPLFPLQLIAAELIVISRCLRWIE